MDYKSADFIRKKRKSLGISMRKLAKTCDIPSSTLCDIENSKFKINTKYFDSISKNLKLSEDERDHLKLLITIDRSEFIDEVINYVAEEPKMYNHVKLVYKKSRGSEQSDKMLEMLNHFIDYIEEEHDVNTK
jgi:transcriptional regulator with XRE-family HTH domain